MNEDMKLTEVNYCFEDWPIKHGRAYYSIFSVVFQYSLPIIIVSVSNKITCTNSSLTFFFSGDLFKNILKTKVPLRSRFCKQRR